MTVASILCPGEAASGMNGFRMRVPFTSSPCCMSCDSSTAQSPKPAGTTIWAAHHSAKAPRRKRQAGTLPLGLQGV